MAGDTQTNWWGPFDRPGIPTTLLAGWPLDAIFTVLAVWMTLGVAMDFRVHAGGISFAEEGFFTPSHIAFYSAVVAIAILLGAATIVNRRRGRAWVDAVPSGYRLGVVGVFLFGLGGPGDLLWHSTFGFEQGVEALTSPTHLLLALGATLFLSSPLRAAWGRSPRRLTLVRGLPAIVSAAFVLNVVSFFTLYGNPLSAPMAAVQSGIWPGHGVLSVAAFVAAMMGLSLALLGRFDLPIGAFTLVFSIVGLLVTAVTGTLVLAVPMVVTGVVTDGLAVALTPRFDRGLALRAFAGGVPLVFATTYFATTAVVWGLGWTTHVWAGAIAVAVFVGLLVSYAIRPHAGAPHTTHAGGQR